MNKEFTLSDFFGFVLSKIKQILIFGIIGALITFCFVKFGAEPTYTCTGSIIVNPFSDEVSDYNASLINAEINVSKNLLPTYLEILTSKDLSEHLSQKLASEGVNVTAGYIRSITKYTTNDQTLVIRISCSSADEATAKNVASAVVRYAPAYVQNIISHGDIAVVDSVGDASRRVTNPYVMAMVAFMVIAIAVVAINLLVAVLDSRVKSVEDIADNFEYPVLGNIPNFYLQNKSPAYKKNRGE